MPRVQFIVPRLNYQEHTFALVTATVASRALTDDATFCRCLTRVLTEWVRTTTDGQHAWANSSEDFNVGDLAMYTTTRTLTRRLAACGIRHLTVTPYVLNRRNPAWAFDRVLVDDDALPRVPALP